MSEVVQSISTPPSASTSKVTRGHSCTLCQRRKVKCDGQKPCSNCVKNQVECVTREPTIPRRRKAISSCPEESAISGKGQGKHDNERNIQDGSIAKSSDGTPSDANGRFNKSSAPEPNSKLGKVIFEYGYPRYIENDLWTEISDELHNRKHEPNRAHRDDASVNLPNPYPVGEMFLFGRPMLGTLKTSHPQPIHIFRLWQTCLDNVNPLAKIFHAPTIQQLILTACSDLDNVDTSTEALMFAVYLSSVISLTEEDCTTMFGESRKVLLTRYFNAAQQALINAGFLKSYDLVVLQAFTLFLLSVRQQYDPQSLWAFTGLAVRRGQRIGLHREDTSQKLSLFESEMRRRLWWQIVILDVLSARLSGAANYADFCLYWDTKRPLNVNDSDLNPNMTELPVEHAGVTEMLFCCIRHEIGNFMHRSKQWEPSGKDWRSMNGSTSIIEKDKAIDQLEHRLQENFLRHCDLSIPFHLLATYLGRSAICQIRLMAHHPRQYSNKGIDLPKNERDLLFRTAMKILEYANLAHSNKSLRGYLWHVNNSFPFDAFIYVLGEMNVRADGDSIAQAWLQINRLYEHHPELIADTSNALYFAIGNLTITAWENTLGGVQYHDPQRTPAIPYHIPILRSQRNSDGKQSTQDQSKDDSSRRECNFVDEETQASQAYQGDKNQWTDVSHERVSDTPPPFDAMNVTMDWEYWESLLEGREFLNIDGSEQSAFLHI